VTREYLGKGSTTICRHFDGSPVGGILSPGNFCPVSEETDDPTAIETLKEMKEQFGPGIKQDIADGTPMKGQSPDGVRLIQYVTRNKQTGK
jgi:hypothetical protein